LRDPQDVPVLEKAFNEESDNNARLAAAFALAYEGKIETSEFSPLRYLVNGLNINKSASTSEAYLTELSHRDDVRQALIPLAKAGTKQEKIGLVHALASAGGADSATAIQSLTSDPDSDVSIAAARSLKTIKAHTP
jgi:HEAT repeat protein